MSQYDQLLLFYDRLLTIADEIEDMIKKELFDDILDKIQIHDKILVQIKLAKKCSDLTEEQQTKIEQIEEELKEKEKKNIETLQTNMVEVKQELDKLKLKDKLKQAYSQDTTHQEQGSIIDVDDNYRN